MNEFMVLMQSWDKVQEYIQTADNASGQSMEKYAAYQESMAGKLEELKNSYMSLSQTVINGDFLKGIVSGGTTALNVVEALIKNFGLLSTAITAISGVMGAKNLG